MARILSFSYNYVPAPSPSATTSNPVKAVSKLALSVRHFNFNRSFKLVGYADREQRRAMVARYRGGRAFDFEEELYIDDDEEDDIPEPDYDPNLDLGRIKSSTVRLLDEENNVIGVMSLREAIRRADTTELLLAIVNANADPPVLRVFEEANYVKHIYERQKKKRNQQKKQGIRAKELKLGYNIDGHDYAVRQKQATKFLREGRKVKIMVTLKGREIYNKDEAVELLMKFQEDIGELASLESQNFDAEEERTYYAVLMPNKATIQREQQRKKNEAALKKKQAEAEANTEEQLKIQEAEANTEEPLKIQEAEANTEEPLKIQEAEASANSEELSANV
ncbi:translation initiation factor IF3-4, chloroplastic-like [Carex rostrata]